MITHGLSFSDYAKHPAYSASDLLAFRRSPQLLADIRNGLAPNKETPAMLFGTAAHLSILEPVRYASVVEKRPDTYMSKGKKKDDPPEEKKWNANSNTCRAFLTDAAAKGKVVLHERDIERLAIMQRRMPGEVREMLEFPAEVSVFSELTVGRLKLPVRIRPDLLSTGKRLMPDLKTINNIEAVEDRVWKLNYHIRAEFYRQVMRAETGHDYGFVLVFVESQSPYRWRIVELDAEYRMISEDAVSKTLEELAAAHDQKNFKDYGDLKLIASPPVWMGEQDDEDEDDEPTKDEDE